MQVGSSSGRRNGVISGSVWESRMKSDEVKGGIKVFNGEENSSVGNGNRIQVFKRLRRNQSSRGVNEKRIEKNPSIQLRKTRSDSQRVNKEINNNVNSVDRIEKNPPPPPLPPPPPPIQITKKSTTTGSDSCNSKDFGVCKEKTILISSSNVDDQIKTQNQIDEEDDDEDEGEEEEEEMEMDEEEDIDNELQKNTTIDVKEIDIEEQKPKVVVNEEKKALIPISSNVIKQSTQVVIHPDLPKSPPKKKSLSVKEVNITEQKPKKVVIEEKKFKTSPLPISSKVIRRPSQPINHPVTDSNFRRKPTISVSEDFERFPETQNKLQNLVDLIMWRDVSKSAFVFGFGTFVLLSSSFTKDINFSFISAISYMGLIYLAAIFLHRSILCRGVVDMEYSNKRVVVGEQEAIWLLKLILPYLNEFLLKIRSLFSGDPTTTMKLAVLLFILARCGSSITIWKVVKLGFFGVFTVPKVCSSYSTQLTGYGKFWVGRFRDAWESCTHKKAVAGAVFTLIWNMSSVVARIWAVFMLIVAVRYYQQSCLIVINEEWEVEDIDGDNTTMYSHENEGRQNT